MTEKRKVQAVIASQECLTDQIYSMWLQFPTDYNVAAMAVGFCHVRSVFVNGIRKKQNCAWFIVWLALVRKSFPRCRQGRRLR